MTRPLRSDRFESRAALARPTTRSKIVRLSMPVRSAWLLAVSGKTLSPTAIFSPLRSSRRLTHRRPIRKLSPLKPKRDLEVSALIRCSLWPFDDSHDASLAHQIRFICNLDAYSFGR